MSNTPNSLNSVCVNTISEINQKISMHKCMVINNGLQLVRLKSAYQRIMWIHCHQTESKLGEYNNERNNTSSDLELDPLILLPVEVWTMILFQVTEVKDLLHLSRTCLLFQEIVNKTKNQWLFKNVFPYLFNYLSRKEILHCRLVCKQWTISVDTFLRNYKLLENHKGLEYPKVLFKSFPFDYTFAVPFCQSTRAKLHLLRDLGLHPNKGNPFIGRSVTLQLGWSHTRTVAANNEKLQQFVQQLKIILKHFGKHIWHLSINFHREFQWPKWFCYAVNTSLKMCVNLKSLHIFHRLFLSCIPGVNFNVVDRPSLENVSLDSSCTEFHLDDKLVSRFSGQLKRFEVRMWQYKNYHTFYWGNLLELQINKGNSITIMESLGKLEKMGNLRKLSICMNGKGNFLEGLVKLTRKFPKLSEIKLKFKGRSGYALKQLCEQSLPPGVVGSDNLISLEIDSKCCEVVSYDFLLYFPYLSSLTIKHCHKRGDRRVRETHVQSIFINGLVGKIEGEGILNIGKYLVKKMDDNTSMYDLKGKIYTKANIWSYLPFLRDFTICCGVPGKKYKYVCTRSVYEK